MRILSGRSVLRSSVVAILLGLICFLPVNSALWRSENPQSNSQSQDNASKAKTEQVIYCGLWRTDGEFSAEMHIKNSLIVAPITVEPVLFMADGTEYDLPGIPLSTAGNSSININDALATAPRAIADHVSSYGSAAIRYKNPGPGAVQGQMALVDKVRSLSLYYEFGSGADTKTGPQNIEALWWKYDSQVSASVGLANTTDRPVEVNLSVLGAKGGVVAETQVNLTAYVTNLIDLEPMIRELPPEQRHTGAVQVQYTGPSGAIKVTGSLLDPAVGYSALMPAKSIMGHEHSEPGTVTFASAGIMIGNPAMMGAFPATTRLTPYTVLRNTSQNALNVEVAANFQMMMGGKPMTTRLATVVLPPRHAEQLDMVQLLSRAKLDGLDGIINLKFSFSGQAQDLQLATGSVDQTGTYVFEVVPQGVGPTFGKEIPFWSTAQGNDTMITLWNATNTAEDLALTLYWNSGHYKLPIHLEPEDSTMVMLSEVKRQNQPDPDGNVLPADLKEGSAVLLDAKRGIDHFQTVAAAGIFNVADATCGSPCPQCQMLSQDFFSPNPTFGAVKGSTQFLMTAIKSDGSRWNVTSSTHWSSNNTSVATIQTIGQSSPGLMTNVAVGTATITGWFLDDAPTPSCESGLCNQTEYIVQGPANVMLMVQGNEFNSIFVGADPNLSGANSIFATVSPTGGTFTEASSVSADTFTPVQSGGPGWVVTTNTQSASVNDRVLTFTYTAEGQTVEQQLTVTARQFAYATNNSPSNTCTLGHGTTFLYTYTPFTHPDHIAVQPSLGLTGTKVSESFNPLPPSGTVTGSGSLAADSTFTDKLSYCSTSALTSQPTVTQSISIEGFQVRQNSLQYSSSGIALTSQGPTQ